MKRRREGDMHALCYGGSHGQRVHGEGGVRGGKVCRLPPGRTVVCRSPGETSAVPITTGKGGKVESPHQLSTFLELDVLAGRRDGDGPAPTLSGPPGSRRPPQSLDNPEGLRGHPAPVTTHVAFLTPSLRRGSTSVKRERRCPNERSARSTVGPYSVMGPRNEKSSTEQPEHLPRTTASISGLELCQILRTRQRVSGVATEGGKGPAVFRPKDAAQSVILASLEATPHGVHVLSLLRQFRRPPGIAYCVVCLSVPEAGEMTNVDLASKGITDIVLRYTRYGLTVLSNTNDTIQNLVQAIQKNAVTHASISVRVPNKRNPHIRITGGDPDVDKDTFFNILKERNAGLEIDEERCKVRVAFCERSGTNTFIGEVDPESFKALMSWPRLSLGLTVLQVSDCLHAPTCTFCVTYGHGRSSSPHKTEASRATCMKYVGNHKVVGCTVCMGERAVCRAESRRAGRPAKGHPAGFPGCPLLMERVASLRPRTNYGFHQ
ncbi:hypothetical protein HPB51_020695 [Rhipicephalus microplus]|uniref:Uncharacterized protein n=1 Tax=Rhipicephalus microplus TaxID=6941 RepID=A0A9J6EUY8_RHIMP|nr:hypothetical protein HPB51_020695 [Rhipicephalus microplus]